MREKLGYFLLFSLIVPACLLVGWGAVVFTTWAMQSGTEGLIVGGTVGSLLVGLILTWGVFAD